MINNKNNSNKFNDYKFRIATLNDFDELIEIIGDYYIKKNLKENIKDKNKPPWSWFNDQNVSYNVMVKDSLIIGFFIDRYISSNIHLHSFFIHKDFRGFGLGRKLLKEHWKIGLQKSSNLNSFTLHIHRKNKLAENFYKKFKYEKIQQSESLLLNKSSLGAWARNCRDKDQWPLRYGIDLYYLPARSALQLCDNISY